MSASAAPALADPRPRRERAAAASGPPREAERPVTVAISGGGTGGHIFSALAIADALREALPSVDILFVGAAGGPEVDAVRAAGYRLETVPIAGIARGLAPRALLSNLLLPARLVASALEARRIVDERRPDLAIGVGGYASAPLVAEAQRRRIPTLVHEQNAVPGIANRILARRASVVCLGMEEARRCFDRRRAVVTGNPIRRDLRSPPGPARVARLGLSPGVRTLLVLGGSLGSATLNRFVLENQRALAARAQVLWSCGREAHPECARRLGEDARARIRLVPFQDDMAAAYSAADLVISGAGALSIAELAHLGKPAIVVPSPDVAEDHQARNAAALARRGAAVRIRSDRARERLLGAALDLIDDERRRRELADRLRSLSRHDANERIVREALRFVPAARRPSRPPP